METFGMDKDVEQIDFEQVSDEDMMMVCGGTGSANVNCWYDGKQYSSGSTYVQTTGNYFEKYTCMSNGTWSMTGSGTVPGSSGG